MRLREIKKGQHFGETDLGLTIICEALEDAQPRGDDCHSLRAKVLLGEAATADSDGVVHFVEANNPGGYGLRLHDDACIDIWTVREPGDKHGCICTSEAQAREIAGDDPEAPMEIVPGKMSRNRFATLPEFQGF